MYKLLCLGMLSLGACSVLNTTNNTSSFGKEYAGTYVVTEGMNDKEGARWLTANVDSQLIAGSKVIVDRAGNLSFTQANGLPLTSGFTVLNDGFFGSMAAYYIIIVAGDRPVAQKGKRFGISLLRGWVSITDISDVKPEGKPDPLYDITKPV